MGQVPLLHELAIVAVLAVTVTVILSRLKLPTTAGLLAAGAIVGPFGLGITTRVEAIESIAELGVVLLLFSIGLEFSLTRLRDIFRQVALGGLLQVGLTIAVTAGAAAALGEPLGRSLLYGFAVSLSSTAIVLRSLAERRELDAPHGRFIVGTLLFQDLCVVPMVLIVPLLAPPTTEGASGLVAPAIAIALGKAAVVVVATLGVARYLVPPLLGLVDASRSREIFLLAILSLCIGTAWLTSLAGLSLALGAFLGGMVVADTEYGRRAMGDILPLRDAFVSVFFVSLGMLFDVRTLVEHPIGVLALLAGFLGAKGLLATAAALVMRFPARVAWLAGVGLAQFGEFGFVLIRVAEDHGVLEADAARPLFAAGVLSMFLTPLLLRAAPHIKAGERLLAPLERLIGVRSIDQADEGRAPLDGHVVVVGFGLAGRFVARALRACSIPFVVLDLDAENVRKGKELGLPVYYGDATSEEALRHASIDRAAMVVLLMNDPLAATRVVDTVRRVAPAAAVLLRTRYLAERHGLLALGARDVVAEEVEGAVEMIARLLRSLDVPRNAIDLRLHEVRLETHTSERKPTVPRHRLGEIAPLAAMKIECVEVEPGSAAAGRSPVELRLRSVTGALVVGVARDGVLLEHADPSQRFETGDLAYLVGTREALERAIPCFVDAARR